MSNLMDIACHNNHVNRLSETVLELNTSYDEIYRSAENIADFAQKLKAKGHAEYCTIPFCHTVEAEAMGGIINLGDDTAGGRAKTLAYKSIDDIIYKKISYEQGLRLSKMLDACRILKQRGEKVFFNLSGPFSILSCLIDTTIIFKSWRSNSEVIAKLYKHFTDELLILGDKICEAGADYISYADPIAIPKILGPKYSKSMVDSFTFDFLNNLSKSCDGHCDILICPLTASVLSQSCVISILPNDSHSKCGKLIPQCANEQIIMKSIIKLIHKDKNN